MPKKHARRIKLDSDREYSYRFTDEKGGALMKCTALNGACRVTLYKLESTEEMEVKSQVGDSYFIARNPGNVFSIGLTITEPGRTWEVVLSGIGAFELELPNRLLSPEKKGTRIDLPEKHDKKIYAEFKQSKKNRSQKRTNW